MIVAMQDGASEEQIQHVIDQLVRMGFEVHRSTGALKTVLGGVGSQTDFDTREVEMLPAVQEVHRITSPYRLAGRALPPRRHSGQVRQRHRNWRQEDCRNGRTVLGRITATNCSPSRN